MPTSKELRAWIEARNYEALVQFIDGTGNALHEARTELTALRNTVAGLVVRMQQLETQVHLYQSRAHGTGPTG